MDSKNRQLGKVVNKPPTIVGGLMCGMLVGSFIAGELGIPTWAPTGILLRFGGLFLGGLIGALLPIAKLRKRMGNRVQLWASSRVELLLGLSLGGWIGGIVLFKTTASLYIGLSVFTVGLMAGGLLYQRIAKPVVRLLGWDLMAAIAEALWGLYWAMIMGHWGNLVGLSIGIFFLIALPHEQELIQVLLRHAKAGTDRHDYHDLNGASQSQGEALRVARKLGNRIAEAMILGEMAMIHQARSELAKALELYKEALRVFRKANHRMGQATVLVNIGALYGQKGEWGKALKLLDKALADAETEKHVTGRASALRNIGEAHRLQGEIDTALKATEQALSIDRRIGDRLGLTADLVDLGLVCLAKNEIDEAIRHHREALEFAREANFAVGEVESLCSLGLDYEAKGELDKAFEHQEKGLEIAQRVGYHRGEARALGNMGLIYKTRGRAEEMRVYFQRALRIFETIGAKFDAEKLRQHLSCL
ncbi:MAG: tetratricopeptide repeat protein [Chloroflexota bacterium]